MLDKKGFDLWADGYDKSVGLSDEANTYPFAGYKDVLSTIYEEILTNEKCFGHWIWYRHFDDKAL